VVVEGEERRADSARVRARLAAVRARVAILALEH